MAAPSKWQDPRGPPVAPPERIITDPLVEEYNAQNSPLKTKNSQHQYLLEGAEAEERPPSPTPYKVNTTGLETSHLPKPPGRRDGANVPNPPSYEAATSQKPAAGPKLPPRLPPRVGVASPKRESAANPAAGIMNQDALNRLGAAGVSVTALGIGRSSKPQPAESQSASSPNPPQMASLQNRFTKMATSSPGPSDPSTSPQGSTWQQKQAALKTASQFQKDPSSVSLSDAKSATTTANNFRQRHGDQVATGMKSANSLNQKYGIANKLGAFSPKPNDHGQQLPHNEAATTTGGSFITNQSAAVPSPGAAAMAAVKKKPPPPPPPKKPKLVGESTAGTVAGPPPIPLSTRPNF